MADASLLGQDGLSSGPPTYTIDDAIQFGRYQYVLLFIVGFAWIVDAMEVLLLSFLGPSLHCEWGISPEQESMITTVVFVGMGIGAYAWGVFADTYGRRSGILWSGVWMLLSGLASAVAPNFGLMLVARGLVGIGIGGVPVAFSMFVEFLPTGTRGTWSIIMQLWWTVGSVAQALLGWAVLPSLGWRWLLAITAAPLVVLVFVFLLMQKSPRFLVSKGRYEEAERVLQYVANVNRMPLPPGRLRGVAVNTVGSELVVHQALTHVALSDDHSGDDMLVASPKSLSPPLEDSTKSSPSPPTPPSSPLPPAGAAGVPPAASPASPSDGLLRELAPGSPPATTQTPASPGSADAAFAASGFVAAPPPPPPRLGLGAVFRIILGPTFKRNTLVLWLLWVTNAFTYYGLVLLTTELAVTSKEKTCEDGDSVLDKQGFVDIIVSACAELPGMVFTILMINRLSRRRLQTLEFSFVAVCFGLLFFFVERNHGVRVVLLFLGRGISLGTFSVTYLYTMEAYPTNIRNSAFGIANTFSRLGGIVAPFVAQGLIEHGYVRAAILVFIALCASAAVASSCLTIETAGKALSEPVAPTATVVNAPARPLATGSSNASTPTATLSSSPGSGAAGTDEHKAAAAARGSDDYGSFTPVVIPSGEPVRV